MKEKNTISWLWRVSGADKGRIAAMTLVQMLLSVLSVLMAWLLRSLIDCAVARNVQDFWQVGAALLGVAAGQLALRAVLRYLTEASRSSLENRLKHRLFGVLLGADYSAVTQVHSGQWMNRLTSDTVVVADAMTDILPGLCGMVVKLLGALGVLIVLIPELYSVILLGGLGLILLTWAFRKKLKTLHQQIQEADGSLRAYMTEQLGSMLVVRAFGKEKTVQQEAQAGMEAHRAARMKRNHFSNICNVGFGTAMHGAYVLGALICGYGILQGAMSYGTFTAVLQLISQIQAPFANLSGFLPRFYGMLASAERLMEAEAFRPDCPGGTMKAEEAASLYESLESIQLRQVDFAYPQKNAQALAGLSLDIPKGSYVAFTGHSGCGKSTVLKLLLALYAPVRGTVVLQTSHGEAALTSWHRSLFAYVPQGNMLLAGTVRQVLTFGEAEVEQDRIWEALEIACAADFVRQLEHGLDTQLSERGAGLSEGQLQRLAIARAVLSRRPVLLLDEATSDLDEETEARILQNLRAMTHKTVVIVTHRPAALEVCDREVHFE